MMNAPHPPVSDVQPKSFKRLVWQCSLWMGLFWGIPAGLSAQQLQVPIVMDSSFQEVVWVSSILPQAYASNAPEQAPKMQMKAVLPSFFRQNPSGYSFLCHKELEIENRLPIGIWIDAETPAYLQKQLGNPLNLRLRLFRF